MNNNVFFSTVWIPTRQKTNFFKGFIILAWDTFQVRCKILTKICWSMYIYITISISNSVLSSPSSLSVSTTKYLSCLLTHTSHETYGINSIEEICSLVVFCNYNLRGQLAWLFFFFLVNINSFLKFPGIIKN